MQPARSTHAQHRQRACGVPAWRHRSLLSALWSALALGAGTCCQSAFRAVVCAKAPGTEGEL
eukprot:11434807-Alexandrium_andersonii.AAC.1